MKQAKHFPFALLLITAVSLQAQVGIGIATPAASAQLDVSSSTKGFLPPRITFTNRNSITSPATGLMIYCTNCGIYGQVQVYNGIIWTDMVGGGPLGGSITIGDNDGGGKVAYILQPGDPGYVVGQTHGLIAAASDQSTVAEWGCMYTTLAGADGTALGTGNQNTIDIMAGCATAGIAARLCGDLVLNGYSDWYLPSKDELNKLYINKVAVGGFSINLYWSSSEYNSAMSWQRRMSDGNEFVSSKIAAAYVRAIRAF